MSEKLSIVIPAYNEEQNIVKCIEELRSTLAVKYGIPYELVIVNDNSKDRTVEVVKAEMKLDQAVRLVSRTPPGGFGRAVRSGLDEVHGDIVVIYMADLSDDPEDVVMYYRKIQEGYDCVYGSRFIKGSKVQHYPKFKLFINRIVNRCIQVMFWTKFNDMTNAFKAYRRTVIDGCRPLMASHFNLTVEIPLKAIVRGYTWTLTPISWQNRKHGMAKLKIKEMGSRYFFICAYVWLEKYFSRGDYKRH